MQEWELGLAGELVTLSTSAVRSPLNRTRLTPGLAKEHDEPTAHSVRKRGCFERKMVSGRLRSKIKHYQFVKTLSE